MATGKLTHPGNIVLAGFGFFLLMMSFLVYMSVKQEIPLVSADYYEQELRYQHKLDAMNNANTYDSRFSARYEKDLIVVTLPAVLSRSLQKGTIRFYCPADKSLDREVRLDASEAGIYTFRRSLLSGKTYKVRLSFSADGKDYYKEMTLQ